MNMNYVSMGQHIRNARRKKHMTQEQLAEKIEMSASFLGHIERGSRAASLETLVAICNALSVSPSELLQDSLVNEAQKEIEQLLASMSPAELKQFKKVLALMCKVAPSWDAVGD